MRCRQLETREHLVEPLRLVVGAGEFALLHRLPRLTQQIDCEHRAMSQQTGKIGSPHRGGRVASWQQHDRTPPRTCKAIYPDGAETGWYIECLVVRREVGQALLVLSLIHI